MSIIMRRPGTKVCAYEIAVCSLFSARDCVCSVGTASVNCKNNTMMLILLGGASIIRRTFPNKKWQDATVKQKTGRMPIYWETKAVVSDDDDDDDDE